MTTSVIKTSVQSYSLHAAFLPHGLRREVGVASASVPVPGHGFRVVRDDDPEVLGDPLEEEPGAPQLVPHVDPFTRADLELPLRNKVSLIQEHVNWWIQGAQDMFCIFMQFPGKIGQIVGSRPLCDILDPPLMWDDLKMSNA